MISILYMKISEQEHSDSCCNFQPINQAGHYLMCSQKLTGRKLNLLREIINCKNNNEKVTKPEKTE